MKKILPLLALFALLTTPLLAQDWSFGAGAGPFVFGRFEERTLRVANEVGTSIDKTHISAATRPGLALDLERSLGDRFAVRFEGTFTEAPLAVRDESNGGPSLDAGKLDVATWSVPLVFRINRNGSFRFHLLAGPALANYHLRRRASGNTIFTGTRSRFGGMAGGGLSWWLSDRFAVEGQLADIVTSSPLERSDFPATATGIKIERPHNVHTTVGLRWRF
jgi:opacity protein-like surface antigen